MTENAFKISRFQSIRTIFYLKGKGPNILKSPKLDQLLPLYIYIPFGTWKQNKTITSLSKTKKNVYNIVVDFLFISYIEYRRTKTNLFWTIAKRRCYS